MKGIMFTNNDGLLTKNNKFCRESNQQIKGFSYDIQGVLRKKCKLNLEQPIQYYLVLEIVLFHKTRYR
jgi:hypothetical protein